MNTYTRRKMKEQKALEFLKSELGEDTTLDFWVFDKDDIEKNNFIKIFKFLFSAGHHVTLWNELFNYIHIPALDKKFFSDEEWEFIEKVSEAKKDCGEEETVYNINNSIETERLVLVPACEEHINCLKKYFDSNPNAFVYYSSAEYTDINFRGVFYINNAQMFAVIKKETGKIIGVVALKELCDYAHLFNIEYFILPDYRRSGYAVEACRSLIDYAFSGHLIEKKDTVWTGIKETRKIDVELVMLTTSKQNIASQKVADKLGFSFDGIQKRGWRIDLLESYDDVMLYSLEKKEKNKR